MQCILCSQEHQYRCYISAAWIKALPQALQVQIEDNALGKVACRPCYRLGEQIVQKVKALRDSLAILKDNTCIALDVTVMAQETEQLDMDQVPPLESPVRPVPDLRKRPLTSPDHVSPTVERASKRIDVSCTPDKGQAPHSRRNLFGTGLTAKSDSPRVQVCDFSRYWIYRLIIVTGHA